MQFDHLRRREFIAMLGGAAAAWPLGARAQAPSRLWKIGVLANEPWPPLEGLRHGLRDLGYVEGKSHRFEYRFALDRACGAISCPGVGAGQSSSRPNRGL